MVHTPLPASYNLGHYDQALKYHQRALAINQELQDKAAMAEDNSAMGIAFGAQGNVEEALDHFMKALDLHMELKDIIGIGQDCEDIGILFERNREHEQAIELWSRGLVKLLELEEKMGCRHPLIDSIEEYLSTNRKRRRWRN